ncbi:SWIM zinc finger family protein [Streptomyces ferrugineus]|nr:SWIM zinc finger family protein [Streptomyces ferrugineus]
MAVRRGAGEGGAGEAEGSAGSDGSPGEPVPGGRPGDSGGDGAVAAEGRSASEERSALEGASGEKPQPQAASAGERRVSEEDPAEGTAGAEAASAGVRRAAPEPEPEPSTPARRAADGAREALRAARAERERQRAESDEAERRASGARRSRRPASTGSRGRPDPGADSLRSRDVRSLLADAFQMPPLDEPQEDDTAAARHGGHEPTTRPTSPSRPAGPSEARSAGSHSDSSAMPTDPVPPAPDTPQIPHSMAAPGRDGELRRTFPAFAPRASSDESRFAESWWGNAWVRALEEGALDAKRLARGRGYAQEGHVDAITVTPGLVLAYVRGSRPRPYRVQVRLRTLDDADWARFLDAVAERPGHIAALLDKEMPRTLADCGVPLLPGPGELDPRCSCPDRGHPCKHAAALCYQTARLLDADPFVLLLLRGRGERQLLDALSRLSAARAARAAQEQEPAPLAGVRATEALDPQRRLPPLPAPLPTPPHPEQPPVYPASPGGPDPFALDQLATDAAARAHALLGTGRDPVGELTLWQDAVRLAAARPGSGLTAATRALYASLASAADRTPADLARAVAAWRQGGLEGLAVLEEPWDPPAGRFDRARPLLLAADLPAFRPWRNHLTHPRGHVQLRFGRDGLWYPYESEPGQDDWWPRGTPDLDPVGALTGLDSVGAAPEA